MTYSDIELFVVIVMASALLFLVVREICWSVERYEFKRVERDIIYHKRHISALYDQIKAMNDLFGVELVEKSGWEARVKDIPEDAFIEEEDDE